jgi:hypothetical protein
MARFLLALLLAVFCSRFSYAEDVYTGSGFFITTNGYFVTNYHVIKGADKIGLRDVQGKTYEAVVVKVDTNNDLALLKVDGAFSALSVVNSRSIRRGARVVTVGFPNIDIQGKEPKLSEGIVSALTGIQDEPTVFQISVPIQQGNSGGPLVSMDGNVVGIVASKLSALYMIKNRGSVPENVNYAIKSNYLNEMIQTDIVISKLVLPPSKRPPKDLVELSERVENSIALVFAVGRKDDVKELFIQCSQAAKEGKDAEVVNLCKQPAEQGVARAQVLLGVKFYNSPGVPKDIHQADKWFRLAAAQGNAEAQSFLGYMYFGDKGLVQDYAEAVKWFRLAAAQGEPGAQVMLSLVHQTGSAAAVDPLRAYMWASLAADQETPHKARAEKMRRDVAKYMSPSKIAEAQEMAAQCMRRNFKNCD